MKKRKLILVLSPLILVLAVVLVFVLIPSAAKAQGLVEYALCAVFPNDIGTNIEDPDEVALFEEVFDVTWSDDYGVYTYCVPVFTGPDRSFTAIRSIAVAYQDQDGNGILSAYDTEVGRYVQVIRF